MKLYHGSNTDIQQIDFAKSKPNKDFGRGFYLTADKHQAQQLAEQRALFFGGEPVINTYLFDEETLKDDSLNIKMFDDYTVEWAEFVVANRFNPTAQAIHNYDIVYGPIANDKVGVQIELFTDNLIDMPTLIQRLKYLQGITFQYFFGTEKAIALLQKI
ncbi:MAG: DUF3990 domain-containing protein [Paludibacteraceae bacterium]|nr:DUF3990 domain-containing protein [Paludibacteraceae bacterium]MBR4563512.1 DUF3990 domain-containing protein [Paludibacteraceae bacterium]